MLNKKMDRRSLRTRKSLQDALISLLLRKDYEAITVKDITDEADVGRSTFYGQHTGKDDLLMSSFENLRLLLIDQQKKALARPGDLKDQLLGFSLAMFEHAGDHKDLYRALVGGRGGTLALNSIRQILAERMREELIARPADADGQNAPQEFVVQYVVGAFMAVLQWWLDWHSNLSAVKVDAMFRRMAMHGIIASNLSISMSASH